MKYLVTGLLTEDESDRALLQPILQGQLDSLALEGGFEAGIIRTSSVRAIDLTVHVETAATALLESSHLLFVHRDHRERGKIVELRNRIGAGGRLIAVAPVLETEAWALAAAFAMKPPGFDHSEPLGPKSIEKLADPKAELRKRYNGRQRITELFGLLGQVEPAVLKQIPANFS